MWPLVQSHDACTFYPVQAVTAANRHGIQKGESEIEVGDIVFCIVQRNQQYYAHIVLEVEDDIYALEPKYWIGNIKGRRNGWCFREHLFGVLAYVTYDGPDIRGTVLERQFPKVSTTKWFAC